MAMFSVCTKNIGNVVFANIKCIYCNKKKYYIMCSSPLALPNIDIDYILVVGHFGLATGSGGKTQSNMHNESCPK